MTQYTKYNVPPESELVAGVDTLVIGSATWIFGGIGVGWRALQFIPDNEQAMLDFAALMNQLSESIENTGWFNVGNFTAGFTYTANNQTGTYGANEYSYSGDIPVGGYIVAPGTNPTLNPLFVNRSDGALRTELAQLAALKESLDKKEVLRMDFAANEYRILEDFGNEPKQLSNIAGFVRNSLAGVFNGRKQWVNRAINTPRIAHDPVTGRCLGYLSEPAVTNLATHPRDFTNAVWGRAGLQAPLANDAIGRSRNLSMETFLEDTSTGTHRVSRAFTTVAATVYMFSVDIKARGRNFAQVRYENAGSTQFFALNVNLTTGAFTTTSFGSPTSTAAYVIDLGGGVYRCIIVFAANNTTSTLFIHTASALGTVSYTGDGASGISVDCGMFSVYGGLTSFIDDPAAPASTVTRAADLLTVSGAEFAKFWNPIEGAIYCEFVMPATTGTAKRIFTVSDGTVNNRISLTQASGNQNLYVVYKVANVGADSAVVSIAAGSVVKVAYLYTATRQDFYVNGALVGFTTNTGAPVVNTLHVGANQVGAEQSLTTIAYLRYYNTPLSADEAIAKTGGKI